MANSQHPPASNLGIGASAIDKSIRSFAWLFATAAALARLYYRAPSEELGPELVNDSSFEPFPHHCAHVP
jgi:hypothetical protein